MAEYKKFMFDNFVIQEGDDLPDFPSELPVPVTETALSVPDEADKTETSEIEQEEEIEEKASEEPISEEEPLPEIITYTEEEVDEKIKEAEASAYEKGHQEAQKTAGAETNLLLEQIDKALQSKMMAVEGIKQELSMGFENMARSLIEKFIPTIADEQAEKILKKFLEENFSNFKREAKLSFYFNPETIGKAQTIVGQLAHKNDYEGKITLQKDATLGKSDCRVEWETGGVERNMKQMQQKAEALIADEDNKKTIGEQA